MDSCSREINAKLFAIKSEHEEVSSKDTELTKAYRLCHKLEQSLERQQKLNTILEEENKSLKSERNNWPKLQEHNISLQKKLNQTEIEYKNLTVKYEAQIKQYQDMLQQSENKNSHNHNSRIIINDLENRVSKLEFSDLTKTWNDSHKKTKTKLNPKRKSPSVTKKHLRKRKISTNIEGNCSKYIHSKSKSISFK